MPEPLDIRSWLKDLGLEAYADAFAANDVDIDLLSTLTREDLLDIGVASVGHRRRILDVIAQRRRPITALEAEVDEPAAPPPAVMAGGPAQAPEAAATVAPGGAAERRNLTIMMCDLVRSTELASRYDPEDVQVVIEAFQNIASGAIARFGGYVAKFMGDGVFAYFGYPNALENDAECALRAGLAIVERLKAVASPSNEPVDARIGVATGLVVVGDIIGEGSARERSVVGETPSMAERLQRLAPPGAVLCGPSTRQLAAEHFIYADEGLHQLRGFDQPVQVWRVTGERVTESRFAATRHTRATSMVGRVQEMALLQDRWETACRGEGQLVLLAGDAGIGKSRLVNDFARSLDPAIHHRISLQCSPHFRDSALFPASRELELSAGFVTGDTPQEKRAKLADFLSRIPGGARFSSEFEALLSLAEEEADARAASPDMIRRRFMEALVGRIEALAADKPVFVQFEDAHWIDPSTGEFMSGLINRLENLAILVVVTYRNDCPAAWADHASATAIKLGRLNRLNSAALVRELVGDALSQSLVDEIVERTDGVPLFLEEVATAMVETEASATGRPGAPDRAPMAVPATLHDTLLSRLDRDPHAKHVAQIASVIGREFRLTLLRAIAPMAEEALQDGLDRLLAAGLLVRQASTTEEIYAFKHGLLHQAAYDTVLLRTREDLHLAIARALQTRFRDIAERRPEVVAFHYRYAGETVRAAELWLAAGRLALTRGAYDEANHQLRAGLAVLAELPDGEARLDIELPLQIALAETLRSARLTGGDEALAACRRARDLSAQLGDVDRLIRVLRLEFGINFNRPDVEAAQAVADAFLKVGEDHGNSVALALGRQGRGSLAFFRGRLKDAQDEFTAGLELRDPVHEREIVAQFQFPTNSLIYMALTELLLGNCDLARARLAEATELAARSSTFALSLTLANGLILLRLMRSDAEAARPLEQLRDIAGARGAPFWVDLVGFHDGWDSARTGDAAGGLPKMIKAVDTFSANAVEIEVPFYESLIAITSLGIGNAAQALHFAGDAIGRIARTGEEWCLPELLRIRALARAGHDRAAAREDIAQARRLADAQGALFWQLRIEMADHALAADELSRRAAADRIGALIGRFRGADATPDLAEARALVG